MIRDILPRGTLIKDGIIREVYRIRELAKSQGYVLTPEPQSNLMTKRVSVTVEKIINQDDPLRAIVVSKAEGEFRDQANKMIIDMDKDNVPFREYMGRSGAPYHQFPVKKIAKLSKYMNEAINESDYLWRQPWWKEIGVPIFKNMLQQYHAQSLINIDKILADPEMAIGDKPEDTGTGWHAPISNRRQLAQNITKASEYMRTTIDAYYQDMEEAILHWPENDILIQLGIGYRGITGGVRSDVDVTDWKPGYQILESTSREVGNDPSSAVHNKVLDDSAWRSGIWKNTTTPYHLDISDVKSYDLVRSIPPATIGGDEDELRLVSADFGWTDSMPTLTKKGIMPVKENIGFGADNISLLGIFLNTAENTRIMMLKSGTPYTMMHYNVIVGQAIGYWAKTLGLHLKFLQIGDDLHIIMPLGEIPLLFEAMGHSLRLKGMVHTEKGDSVFVLGKWMHWTSKKQVTAIVAPRYLKSLTSAKRKEAGTLPQSVKVGETYVTENIDPDIDQQIEDLWTKYHELIYFKGTPEQYVAQMNLIGSDGYKALSGAGVMDWMAESDVEVGFGRETVAMSAVTTSPALDKPLAGPGEPEVPIKIDTELKPLPTQSMPEESKPIIPSGDTKSISNDKPSVFIYGCPGIGKTTIKNVGIPGYTIIDDSSYASHVIDATDGKDHWTADIAKATQLVKPGNIVLGMMHNIKDVVNLNWNRKILLKLEASIDIGSRLKQRITEGKNTFGGTPEEINQSMKCHSWMNGNPFETETITISKTDSPEDTIAMIVALLNTRKDNNENENADIKATPGRNGEMDGSSSKVQSSPMKGSNTSGVTT